VTFLQSGLHCLFSHHALVLRSKNFPANVLRLYARVRTTLPRCKCRSGHWSRVVINVFSRQPSFRCVPKRYSSFPPPLSFLLFQSGASTGQKFGVDAHGEPVTGVLWAEAPAGSRGSGPG